MIDTVETPLNTAATRFLTFRIDQQLYALRSDQVLEVIRVPAVARIPQGPAALLGLANLRGAVLPVAGLRELLEKPPVADSESARAIVLDMGAPVAVVVGAVETLEAVNPGQIETRTKEVSAAGAEKLLGAFAIGRNSEVAKILDIKTLLESAFSNRARTERRERAIGTAVTAGAPVRDEQQRTLIVTFDVASQEFALPVEVVQEILPVPPTLASVAQAEDLVLGVISVRDSLLPLMSLRGLLGFEASAVSEEREKVVVATVAGAQIGLVVDRARSIVAAELINIEPIPPVIAARTGGESRIKAIYRGDGGRRLISILSPEQLFREDVMQRLAAAHQGQKAQISSVAHGVQAGARTELIFLVFKLGDDEFGLPIEAVVEVAQMPSQVTRVPKTPKFLEGVVNLRGEVLPVVDQRRRFDMPTLENAAGRRLVIIKSERHRAGLIVDSVVDVLRVRPENVDPPPDLTDDTSRLIRGVVNLEAAKRMVLLLDPTEVLTRAERGLLDKFQESQKASV